MKVRAAAALVTGANRGPGDAITQALVDSGAKMYGAARDITSRRRRRRADRVGNELLRLHADAQAFTPVLHDNVGGALANVLSVLSFISIPGSSLRPAR